jgi:UDP:flavonoid glycosyltransferase YjiC (YdhE family)
MRRILLATIGSLGDLHPYIAIAQALARRGAEPVIATAPDYRAEVEREGIAFHPVGPGFGYFGDYRALMQKLFEPRRGTEFLVREIVMPHLRSAYADMSKAAEGADLLVSHPLTVTLPLIAEQRRLPWAATVLSPLSLMSPSDPPLIAGVEWLYSLRRLGRAPYQMVFSLLKLISRRWEAPLRELRRELGLPPARGLALLDGQFSPYLNLALFDPHLATPQPDWPRNLHITGAPLHDGAMGEDERRALDDFLAAGEPPLVFALGSSAVWVAGDFWQHAIEAAQRLRRRALLITGRDTPLGLALPHDIRAFPYLPYSLIFPRALAVIHQAGIGTLSQALRSGRPQLIVPFAFDQPDNARRAAALGLARVLPLRKVSPRSLADELAALLDRASYAERAAPIARELAAINGAERAAEALLTLL